MSAYTTRKITANKARELLTQHYAQKIALVARMDTQQLESEMDTNISDTDGFLLTNFTVLEDYDYMEADIS